MIASGDRAAPRVPITNHPDVRRSLLLQKSYAEGLRALVCYTASWQDRVTLATAEGDETGVWTYDTQADLTLAGGTWQVAWSRKLVEPSLNEGAVLDVTTIRAARGAIMWRRAPVAHLAHPGLQGSGQARLRPAPQATRGAG